MWRQQKQSMTDGQTNDGHSDPYVALCWRPKNEHPRRNRFDCEMDKDAGYSLILLSQSNTLVPQKKKLTE